MSMSKPGLVGPMKRPRDVRQICHNSILVLGDRDIRQGRLSDILERICHSGRGTVKFSAGTEGLEVFWQEQGGRFDPRSL